MNDCVVEDNALDESFYDCYLGPIGVEPAEATPEELAAEDERHEREEAEAEGRRHKSKRRYLRR